MQSHWKRFRYRLEWIAFVPVARLIPLLSRKSCFRLANLLGSLMMIFSREGRNVAISNLEVALAADLSPSQRRKVARESFQHFTRTMLDLLWSPRLTRENFSRFIELDNFEEVTRATGPERSVIIACFHYSNFEWLSLACGFLDLTGTIITQELKNPLVSAVFRKIRQRSGHEMISRERGVVRLYKVLRRKGRTALLVDLSVPPARGAVAINCFGLKTSVTAAQAWLSEQTGGPVVPAHCEPLPQGRYRLVFHPKIETQGKTHQEIAQACWDSFEPFLRKNPAPWLWMYKQWRYRPANPKRPYPFYSSFSPELIRLIRETSSSGAAPAQ